MPGRAAPRRVLVTDGGTGQGRSALAAVRALAVAGYEPEVTTSAPHSLAAASRWCRAAHAVPAAGDRRGYEEAIADLRARREYLTVVAASDAALLALGAPVDHLVDKAALARAAERAGFGVPSTERYASTAAVAAAVDEGEVALPVVVKPVVSVFPARRVRTVAELRDAATLDGPVVVQPVVDGPLRAVAAVVAGGRAVAAVAQVALRTWPVECGTSSAAETIAVDEALLGRLVALAGSYEGVVQAQWVGDHLVDVNPRVYGSLPLAVRAGANLLGVWCDVLRGEVPRAPVRARPGVRYRWLEGDVRHVVARLRSREITPAAAVRALRPVAGSAHSVESLRDPGPLVARVRYAIAR